MSKWLLQGLLMGGICLSLVACAESNGQDKNKDKEDKPTDSKEVKLPSGLKYTDLKVGTGAEAKKGDTVEVHYTGWLTNGQKFDSSVGKTPFSFKLGAGDVIKGWDEGVAGMKVGGKRKLTIPPELGYGKRGAGADIPPDSTLIFEVELLKIKQDTEVCAMRRFLVLLFALSVAVPVVGSPSEERALSSATTTVDEVVTRSGLKYLDVKPGTGAEAKKGDTVEVHYTGWLTNGQKFDSSLDRKQPFAFQVGVGQVIKGWDEGLVSMRVGGKRKLIIPPELGYGKRGAGNVIPPNAVMIFEIELLKIK